MSDFDAVVVGAGQNGLVAANILADRGWSVLVLEQQPEPGGAVQSAEVTRPGFVTDLYSSFYPLTIASPVYRDLDLTAHGLRWRWAPNILAHPLKDGPTAYLSRELEQTVESMERFAPGDGEAWRKLYDRWERIGPAFMDTLLSPFPPVRGAAQALGPLGADRPALHGPPAEPLPARARRGAAAPRDRSVEPRRLRALRAPAGATAGGRGVHGRRRRPAPGRQRPARGPDSRI